MLPKRKGKDMAGWVKLTVNILVCGYQSYLFSNFSLNNEGEVKEGTCVVHTSALAGQ